MLEALDKDIPRIFISLTTSVKLIIILGQIKIKNVFRRLTVAEFGLSP